MNVVKLTMLHKWCDQLWLYVLYLIGIGASCAMIILWGEWTMPQRLLSLLILLLPLHVFEENTFPGGFPFMNNVGMVGSPEPKVYPQNMVTNMITNLGFELLLIGLFFLLPYIPLQIVTMVALFGIIQLIMHTRLGIKMYQRYKDRGKVTIYGPGMVTTYVGLLQLSVYAIYWLSSQAYGWMDFVWGFLLTFALVFLTILLPFIISTRVKSQRYALFRLGYFEKYEE